MSKPQEETATCHHSRHEQSERQKTVTTALEFCSTFLLEMAIISWTKFGFPQKLTQKHRTAKDNFWCLDWVKLHLVTSCFLFVFHFQSQGFSSYAVAKHESTKYTAWILVCQLYSEQILGLVGERVSRVWSGVNPNKQKENNPVAPKQHAALEANLDALKL